jgi:hypothetical protein
VLTPWLAESFVPENRMRAKVLVIVLDHAQRTAMIKNTALGSWLLFMTAKNFR